MRYRVDSMSLRDGVLMLEGWCIPSKTDKIEYSVVDRQGNPMKCTAVARDRVDVAQQFGADRMSGFTVAVPFEREQDGYLVMRDGTETRRVRINNKIVEKRNSIKAKRAEKLWALVHLETLVVSWDFIRENGFRAFWKKAVHKIQKIDEDYDYPEWQFKTALSEAEIEAQRTAWQSLTFDYLKYMQENASAAGQSSSYSEASTTHSSQENASASSPAPLISIVIPAYNTPEKYLVMLLDSFRAQTYPNFEAVIADGSEGGHTDVRRTVERYAAEDPKRFKYVDAGGNQGIAGNTNAGLRAASGDFIALCDHDDELPPWALYEVVKAISAHPKAQFIYTDEDKIDFDGKALFEPHFKSDFNMELLCSVNYICHLSVIRRDLLGKVGGFRAEFDGAQDHDFFFRCLEEATKEERVFLQQWYEGCGAPGFEVNAHAADTVSSVSEASPQDSDATAQLSASGMVPTVNAPADFSPAAITELREGRFTSETVIHIPVICYHWRYHKGSTASDPKAKLYAFEAGSRAVKAHYDRMGLPYEDVEKGVTYGYYHTKFKTPAAPLVSVIIPNKDHSADLDQCIRSVIAHSNYRSIEFIVVENNSTDPETFRYYQKAGEVCFDLAEAMRQNGVAGAEDKSGPAASEAGVKTEPDAAAAALKNEEAFRTEAAAQKDSSTVSSAAEHSFYENSFGDHIPVRIVRWVPETPGFNYSAINNFGVQQAKGDLLLFLNNDVELISPDSITEMVSYTSRPEVGITGARLMYGDDTIQHAGVIVGLGGIAGAAFVGLHEKENSYMHRMMCVQDLSAVTAACLMMKKETFLKVGGFREELAVAFNDIDLCMKVRATGRLVVYDPYVTFHHYESKSRGLEDTPEKVQRFNNEIAIFAHYWGEILEHGDPYYNPNLTLRKANFALRDLLKEKPGEPYKLELDVEKQLKTVLREKERRGLK